MRVRPVDAPSGWHGLRIPVGPGLAGDLVVPPAPIGITLFAHGSGSSRLSSRNRLVAAELNARGVATLLFDLLTPSEETNRENVFDVELLAGRLVGATRWLLDQPQAYGLEPCFFGAGTGAAAALAAAAHFGARVRAVVSRGGRPDLAEPYLRRVSAPTLLIAGADDRVVLDLNRRALAALTCERRLAVVRGASHLLSEPGALEKVATLAGDWITRHLAVLPEGPSPLGEVELVEPLRVP